MMGELGFWIFLSVVVFCILLWNLSKLRFEYEARERKERLERITQLTNDEEA
jgi:hypothetical protein